MDGSARVLYIGCGDGVQERADRIAAHRDTLAIRVADTESALFDALSEERVDCVVSEHDPDTLNGIELLSRVRDVDPAVPFILFTANGSEAVASAAVDAGVSNYVPRSDDGAYADLADACQSAADQYLAERDVAMLNDLARNVYERITDAFFAVDRDWNVTYVNEEAEELLDVRAEDVIDENLWDEFEEAVGSPFYTEFHRAIATQEAVTFTERYDPIDEHLQMRAFPSEDGLSVHFHAIDPGNEAVDGAHLLELTNVLSYDLIDSIERAQTALNDVREGDREAIDDVAEALDRMDDLVNHSITLASNPD
ncbi:response regulator [Salarchaeum sp. III]|uniref:response regulator n=1 Tax=Salarchaeum sp. III TaxID=3107927 RepID=UPI002EDB4CC7